MSFKFDRRQMLAGAALAFVPASALAAAAAPGKPPAARIEVARDTYFGETLEDPYRWMENPKDPDWLPFLKAQNDYTRSVLDALPGRDGFLKRIQELSGAAVATGRVQWAGQRLFYAQRPLGADNFKLFVREGDKVRVLVDPTQMSAAGAGHFSLDWWSPSPDGSHLVYGVSKDGSEDSLAHIMKVADGSHLPETIPNTQAANPNWLDDGAGFFYNQLTGAVDTPERFLDSQARFHRLNTDPGADPILMKRGLDPAVAYEKIQAPYIITYNGSDRVALGLADVRPEIRLYLAPLADVLAGKAKWTEVATFDDEITGADIHKGELFLLSTKGAPRGKVLKTSAATPDLKTAAVVIPQDQAVIEDINRARDGLYMRMMDGGIYGLRKLSDDGKVTKIALPFDGTIGGLATDPDRDGALFALTGWLNPLATVSIDAAGKITDTGITPKPDIAVGAVETHRFFATAKDGTKIPYTVIHKKGLKLDGSNPTYIQAYGSYGSNAYTPSFAGRSLALIEAGAVVGYANVRGGGEYGKEWHQAGQLANKPNTWRDLIACCEDLIAKKYTRPSKLVIGGRSAGGITVGRAMTERPDLFAAVIDGVGWSNPLRYVVEQNGYGEEPEWGAIADPNGYKYLKAIDSYQAVKDGVAYPAVLLTTGVTDPRVAPFHVAKMAARLQKATSSGKPILLRVDFDAGHGIGSTRAQQDKETADTYAFIVWRTKG